MINRVSLGLLLTLTSATATAKTVQAVPAEPRATVSSLGERGGWGLVVGVAILGLALRRRRPGPVVLS